MKRESVPIRNKRGAQLLPTYKRATFTVLPCILPDKQGFCLPPSYRLWQSVRRAQPFKKTPFARCLFCSILQNDPQCFVNTSSYLHTEHFFVNQRPQKFPLFLCLLKMQNRDCTIYSFLLLLSVKLDTVFIFLYN